MLRCLSSTLSCAAAVLNPECIALMAVTVSCAGCMNLWCTPVSPQKSRVTYSMFSTNDNRFTSACLVLAAEAISGLAAGAVVSSAEVSNELQYAALFSVLNHLPLLAAEWGRRSQPSWITSSATSCLMATTICSTSRCFSVSCCV